MLQGAVNWSEMTVVDVAMLCLFVCVACLPQLQVILFVQVHRVVGYSPSASVLRGL
jgi:hypothetical protein